MLRWWKMSDDFQSKLPALRATVQQAMHDDVEKFANHVHNWQHAIELLIEAWPEQAKIADFKGQTPLMLVANKGNAKLTKLLAPLSDVNAQDFIGRTALHSAVCGRSPECVAIVLDLNPDVEKVTFDEENTALHTAVRFGVPENVALIVEAFPCRADKANAAGQTPLDMARDLHANWDDWKEFMRKQNRQIGSKADFEAIIALLSLESQ